MAGPGAHSACVRALALACLLAGVNAQARGPGIRAQAGLRITPGLEQAIVPAIPFLYVTADFTTDDCSGVGPTVNGGNITTTRTGTATCKKANGALVSMAANTPRCNASGCFAEASTTNFAARSELLDNTSTWKTTNVTVTAEQTVAPDGNTTGDVISDGTATGVHKIVNAGNSGAGTTSVSTITYWEFTIFAKPGTLSWVRLSNSAGSVQQTFNISTCAVGSVAVGGAQIVGTLAETYAQGFCRIGFVYLPPANLTESPTVFVGDTEANTGTSYTGANGTLTLWGMQFASPGGTAAQPISTYIPVTGSSANHGNETNTAPTPSFMNSKRGSIRWTAAFGSPFLSSGLNAQLYAVGASPAPADRLLLTSTATTITSSITSIANLSTVAGRTVSGCASWASRGSVVGQQQSKVLQMDGTTKGVFNSTVYAVGTPTYLGASSGSSLQLRAFLKSLTWGSTQAGCQ